LHIRYTARQGVEPGKVKESLDTLFSNQSEFALLFSLRHDFPTQWSAFVNGAENFTATIRKEHFPYFTQGKRDKITINDVHLYGQDPTKHHTVNKEKWKSATDDLRGATKQSFTLAIDRDPPGPNQVMTDKPDAQVFLVIRYSLSQ
jgi:hypothetical protein